MEQSKNPSEQHDAHTLQDVGKIVGALAIAGIAYVGIHSLNLGQRIVDGVAKLRHTPTE